MGLITCAKGLDYTLCASLSLICANAIFVPSQVKWTLTKNKFTYIYIYIPEYIGIISSWWNIIFFKLNILVTVSLNSIIIPIFPQGLVFKDKKQFRVTFDGFLKTINRILLFKGWSCWNYETFSKCRNSLWKKSWMIIGDMCPIITHRIIIINLILKFCKKIRKISCSFERDFNDLPYFG